MNDIKQLISKRVQSLHPSSLIRDLVIESMTDDHISVNYLVVKQDDSYHRVSLTLTMNKE